MNIICDDDEKFVVVTNDVKWIPNVLYTIKSDNYNLNYIINKKQYVEAKRYSMTKFESKYL